MEAFAMSESDLRPFPVLDPASVEPRRGAAYPEHLRSPFAAREKRALGDPLDDGTDGTLDSPLERGGFELVVPRCVLGGRLADSIAESAASSRLREDTALGRR